MKPAPFEYHLPEDVGQATALLGELGDDGRILAGGQSLLPLMNFRLAQPEHIVDINGLGELDYIRREDGSLAVGAIARQSAVELSGHTRSEVPLLYEALQSVAHPPVRHRGTVVGSVAHADPAAELPAVAVALGAQVTMTGASGSRSVGAEDFFLGPFETVVEPGELVTEVSFPLARPGEGTAFTEFARRHGDFAVAGAAVRLGLEEDRVAGASIVLCAVGPRPMRAAEAERLLEGRVPDADLIEAAARAAAQAVEPGADIHGGTEYRRGVTRSEVRRALSLAVERARGGASA